MLNNTKFNTEKYFLDKAIKEEYSDQPCFFNDEICYDSGYLFDYLVDQDLEDEDIPKYVWEAIPYSFVNVDSNKLINWINEESYEDFDVSKIKGWNELEEAINKFNKLNEDTLIYNFSYKKAYILSDEFIEEIKKDIKMYRNIGSEDIKELASKIK